MKNTNIYNSPRNVIMRLCTTNHLSLNSTITLDRSNSTPRSTLVNAVDYVAGDFDVVILLFVSNGSS